MDNKLPPDYPNDAPRPDGRPRCADEYDGKRCTRLLGHEDTLKKYCRHHTAADHTRWTVGRRSGLPSPVAKCAATYQGEHRCDRWEHGGYGYHHANAHYPEGKIPRQERIEWTGTGVEARRRVREADDGYRTEGEHQAMRMSGISW